jgi:hypothetical protein
MTRMGSVGSVADSLLLSVSEMLVSGADKALDAGDLLPSQARVMFQTQIALFKSVAALEKAIAVMPAEIQCEIRNSVASIAIASNDLRGYCLPTPDELKRHRDRQAKTAAKARAGKVELRTAIIYEAIVRAADGDELKATNEFADSIIDVVHIYLSLAPDMPQGSRTPGLRTITRRIKELIANPELLQDTIKACHGHGIYFE